MIDHDKRRAYAELLGRFRDGLITNVEYEKVYDGIIDGCGDVAIREIYGAVWFTYCDVRTHELDGDRTLPTEAREAFDRCILFLGTDLEHEWPLRHNLRGCLAGFLGLGRRPTAADRAIWPFLREEDLQEVLSRG
ncbi:MAG: hypothetical protein GY851_36290 [bacterium]|nr:hypothetical protein [bacterium]